jgi:hypothetical protein
MEETRRECAVWIEENLVNTPYYVVIRGDQLFFVLIDFVSFILWYDTDNKFRERVLRYKQWNAQEWIVLGHDKKVYNREDVI